MKTNKLDLKDISIVSFTTTGTASLKGGSSGGDKCYTIKTEWRTCCPIL